MKFGKFSRHTLTVPASASTSFCEIPPQKSQIERILLMKAGSRHREWINAGQMRPPVQGAPQTATCQS